MSSVSTAVASVDAFVNWPPFYTLQPNLESRAKQLQLWCTHLARYFEENRVCVVDVATAANSVRVFSNSSIQRSLRPEDIRVVLDALVERGLAGWVQPGARLWVSWRSADEWATLIAAWVSKASQAGQVVTLFELAEGALTAREPFHRLDEAVLLAALRALELRGAATVLQLDDAWCAKFA